MQLDHKNQSSFAIAYPFVTPSYPSKFEYLYRTTRFARIPLKNFKKPLAIRGRYQHAGLPLSRRADKAEFEKNLHSAEMDYSITTGTICPFFEPEIIFTFHISTLLSRLC